MTRKRDLSKRRKYRYLFGPVPSRRFGRSLGVDLTPFKTCSLDCIFCQLGRTTHKTVVRQEYVPTAEVIAELEKWLETDGKADYITLSGSGEPTLHSCFGEVIEFIKVKSTIPTALLTNGTMLQSQEVRQAASQANTVKVSLSAWDQDSYERVNRPHQQLQFDQLVESQRVFAAQFSGKLWLEIFLIEGVNSMPEDVRKIAALVRTINVERVQFNTAIRPSAEQFVKPLSHEDMRVLVHLFQPPAEIIPEFSAATVKKMPVTQEMVFSMLQRRPCTAEQIADAFNMHPNEVAKYLGRLLRTERIRTVRKNGVVYYLAAGREVIMGD
ncbi:MAG: radical SAM protein [Deltaproteobacteria bacterium]|nr:radical SAM protein [Deltaproteobacteria bacterium]